MSTQCRSKDNERDGAADGIRCRAHPSHNTTQAPRIRRIFSQSRQGVRPRELLLDYPSATAGSANRTLDEHLQDTTSDSMPTLG